MHSGAHKSRPSERKNRSAMTTLLSIVAVLVGIACLVIFVPAFQIGQHVQANCEVAGSLSNSAEGKCTFTNTGWTPGSMCVVAKLVNGSGGEARSGPVCSGRVWPNDSSERNVSILIDRVCGFAGLAWQHTCRLEIESLRDTDSDRGSANESGVPGVAQASHGKSTQGHASPGASAGMQAASGAYLTDMCKKSREFKNKFALIGASKTKPDWMTSCDDGVQSLSQPITLAGRAFVMFTACKPHDCGSQQIIVLYDGQALYGAAVTTDDQGNPRQDWITPVDPQIRPLLSQLASQ
ncbi:MAG TPA: Ivy family c-type lysozyme inhibitor [Dyella sp.]